MDKKSTVGPWNYQRMRSNTSHGKAADDDKDDQGPFRSALPDEQLMSMKNVVKKLMEPGKGIWAIDEIEEGVKQEIEDALINIGTSEKRKDSILAFIDGCREITAEVSGILFHDHAFTELADKTRPVLIRQSLAEANDLCIGARVGTKIEELYGSFGELTSCGLDTLASTCTRLKNMGVGFTEWKYPVTLSQFTPSFLACLHNANTVARYAMICQVAGLVPIIAIELQEESKVKDLELNSALSVMQELLAELVKTLADHHVSLEAVIIRLSPLWISPTVLKSPKRTKFQQLAMAVWIATTRTLPPSIGGLALADGATLEASLTTLNELHLCPCFKSHPVTYCWGRVLRGTDLPEPPKVYDNKNHSVEVVDWLKKKLKVCSLASMGQFSQTSGSLFVTCISSFC